MQTHELDELDIKLLKALQNDSTMTNQSLSQKLHSSPATCLRRISRLKSLGFIKKEVMLLNPNMFPESVKAIVEITLEKQTAEAISNIEKVLIKEQAVKQCYRVAANSDIVIVIDVPMMSDYHDFVQRVLSSHYHVRNIRALFITHQSKFDTAIPIK
ncbi:Lrp/AsnC family transcriptional regulator [Thorsellia anophelis]|uniref:Lrp/AsnC family transcriptional regulator, leucine-responsive regulatory protein n=1 Tax=Thorsellia anophelis DSM 18579 TaxID=1123402 RepID=A0A1H9ZXT9_9GAMM|nr:Lrp/AsnC family transcriptional regulator [Thorsellia anophelis]SES86608.1 Lrp/AsnC family transcriptional regulator, leucine-responsive regulatory protein [Thorsellia anophelis DSM 18579]